MRLSRLAGLLNSSASLVGTTWVLKNKPSITHATYDNPVIYSLDFYDDYFTSTNPHTQLAFYADSRNPFDCIYYMLYGEDLAYYYSSYEGSSGWENEGYKTIHITGGTDATNAILISWLQANATQVT